MPRIISKTIDPAKRGVKSYPALPEKRAKVVEKLKQEVLVAQQCVDKATQQKTYFERKWNSIPGYQNETVIGADLTQFLVPRSQDKYHLVRWEFAVRTATKRLYRLTKLLKAKLKGYE